MKRMWTWALVGLSLFGCKTTKPGNSDSLAAATAKPVPAAGTGAIATCYGYRGNGTSVFATIGGMARLLDQFDAPGAVVGTSSGSVAAFLTESIMVPNDVYQCPGCTAEQIAERRSFMLKSFPLVIEALTTTEGLATDLKKIQKAREVFDLIIDLFPPTAGNNAANPGAPKSSPLANVARTPDQVQAILSATTLGVLKGQSVVLKNFIDPNFFKLSGVGGPAQPALVRKAIGNTMTFFGASDKPFQRQNLMYPGVINFDYLFSMMGVVGDWYAGYGSVFPRAALNDLLNSCAKDTRGVWWNAAAEKPYGASTCGGEYFKLYAKYFNDRLKNADGKRRINEAMGTYLPAFVSSSAIGGNDIVAAMTSSADFGTYDKIDALDLGRENFKVLYFGPASFKSKITQNKAMFNDVITTSIVSMGAVPWLQGMKASGQEPATTRSMLFVDGGQQYLSTGGFVDQIESKFMKMIGCQTNILINTNTPIFGFANTYAPRIWNKDTTLVNDMLDPNDPNSAESIAFPLANALLCSRWESYAMKEVWQMADNSYHNIVFVDKEGLGYPLDKLKNKAGDRSTRVEPAKTCYSLPKERREQYEPYKIAPGA